LKGTYQELIGALLCKIVKLECELWAALHATTGYRNRQASFRGHFLFIDGVFLDVTVDRTAGSKFFPDAGRRYAVPASCAADAGNLLRQSCARV
jgi:hypothetical protein